MARGWREGVGGARGSGSGVGGSGFGLGGGGGYGGGPAPNYICSPPNIENSPNFFFADFLILAMNVKIGKFAPAANLNNKIKIKCYKCNDRLCKEHIALVACVACAREIPLQENQND